MNKEKVILKIIGSGIVAVVRAGSTQEAIGIT